MVIAAKAEKVEMMEAVTVVIAAKGVAAAKTMGW